MLEAYSELYTLDSDNNRKAFCRRKAPFLDMCVVQIKCLFRSKTAMRYVDHLFSIDESRKAFKNYCHTTVSEKFSTSFRSLAVFFAVKIEVVDFFEYNFQTKQNPDR